MPAAAGGNLDNVTRDVAQRLPEQLGQTVIVDNRPGGNYKVAVDFVAKAPADGYTYLAIADSFLYAPAIERTASYDPIKDTSGSACPPRCRRSWWSTRRCLRIRSRS